MVMGSSLLFAFDDYLSYPIHISLEVPILQHLLFILLISYTSPSEIVDLSSCRLSRLSFHHIPGSPLLDLYNLGCVKFLAGVNNFAAETFPII